MKGICFIEPLHRKVVSGEKTQTRRIVNPQPIDDTFKWHGEKDVRFKPRYKPGEILYLKEPYCLDCDFIQHGDRREWKANGKILYEFNGDGISELAKDSYGFGKWRNKLFMPEKYARHHIEITDVRVERLQDINDYGCAKEGIVQHLNPTLHWSNETDGVMYSKPVQAYAALINKINGKGTWESNPFVWVYDFKLIKSKTMNRTIKYRGKRTDNGEWVYGYYFTTPLTAEYNIEPVNGAYFDSGRSICRHVISNENGVVFEIIPETVGQFTEVRDTDKTAIYEGDLLGFNGEAFIVKYYAPHASFYATDDGTPDGRHLRCWDWREVEVIGNIHDNPELFTTK
jgi:hypothetical protein